jgi:hypothetical protein
MAEIRVEAVPPTSEKATTADALVIFGINGDLARKMTFRSFRISSGFLSSRGILSTSGVSGSGSVARLGVLVEGGGGGSAGGSSSEEEPSPTCVDACRWVGATARVANNTSARERPKNLLSASSPHPPRVAPDPMSPNELLTVEGPRPPLTMTHSCCMAT